MSGGFSPTNEPLSPTPDLDITIEEGSENSEQLLQEEGSQHEIDSEEVFRIESNDPGRGPVLGIERNDLQNDGDQVLEFGSNDQVLRIESNHNENNGGQMLEIESNYHENGGD
ncbi:hypothetical protein LOK49_LG04G02502 [Camellia lanceoleosa]|uniref:Uncharacterized protein n=1 Tax=Camellia lanceoleosa TaxID=1840588 RepID=A0ACC0HWK2_9ERIC|nr:hypothetical protein LOK49_LG04G02502 [Camellia lanceoleosa]